MPLIGKDGCAHLAPTILHVANFSDRPKGAGFAALQYKLTNGLVRGGHNVVTFSDREVARASTPLLSRPFGRRGANRRLLALARALGPDVVLFGHADTILPETVAALRDLLPGVRMAQWNVDALFDPDNVARILSKAALLDWTFVTTGGALARQLAGHGVNVAFLPNAVDASIERHRAFEREDQPWDVFYAAGSPTLLRHHCGVWRTTVDIVAGLRRDLPHRRFLTPGIGLPHLEGSACLAAMASARVGLNISRRNDVPLYSSDRMAHLAGNGLLVVTERASGFDALFAEDEMAFFGAGDDLAAMLERFLADDHGRRAVARRGWLAYHRMFGATRVAAYVMDVLDGVVDPACFDWRAPAERALAVEA